MKKFLIAALVLILGSCAVLNLGKQPEPFTAGSQSETRLAPGPFEVVMRKEVFVDTTRPTQANGDYEGDDKRTLEGAVWQPASDQQGPYPLIVYSHGFTSSYKGGAYLAEHLASLGYVVVSVSYPLTNMSAPGGPLVNDVVNQPGDVSFLIDTLIGQSATDGHPLRGMVDSDRIGVTGLSLGGMTTALVAFHPDKRDPRISAALSIAGPTEPFTEVFFTHASMPFLMLAGDIDALVPYPTNAAPVPEIVPGGELVTIVGASHTGFAGPAGILRWMSNPDSLACRMIKDQVEEAMDDPWYDQIGTPEQGINHQAVNELCLMDPLPDAINVLRQHMITTVVVASFFQAHFGAAEQQALSAQAYLSQTLENEVPEVSYRAAD
jgi:dienelactone hydrolase